MPLPIFTPRNVCRSLMSLDLVPFPPKEEYGYTHTNWENNHAFGLVAVHYNASGEKNLTLIGKQDCFDDQSDLLTENAVFNIASITKPFTVATILRMMEEEEFAKYFPDKLNTKISSYSSILKKRYPESNYINERFDREDQRIDLKDIIMHISGIGEINYQDFYEKLAFESQESLARPIDGKFLEVKRLEGKYQEYQYSDVGYELLGMLVCAIASDARIKQVTFGQISRELVIDVLGLKHTYTAEEMALIDGKIKVAKNLEQEVAQAYACRHDGYLNKSLGYRRCMSTSGMYSNVNDLCEFAARTFCDNTYEAGGLFKNKETIKLRNSFQVNQYENGKILPNDFYGIGFMFSIDQNGKKICYHGATTPGYSGRLMWRDDGSVSCCLVNCEQITSFFAKALFAREVTEGKTSDDILQKQSRFYQIRQELLEKYKLQELVEILTKANWKILFGDEENFTELRKQNFANLFKEFKKFNESKLTCSTTISNIQASELTEKKEELRK